MFSFDGCDCGLGDFIPDDQGYINIQPLAREIRARKEMSLSDAQALLDRALAALVRAGTPSAPRLRDALTSEWENVRQQPGPLFKVAALNELLIQSLIEFNAAHAGDQSWALEKQRYFTDMEEVVKNIPETVTEAAGSIVAMAGEAIGRGVAGAGEGLGKGFIKSPAGVAIIALLGYWAWKTYRGRHA